MPGETSDTEAVTILQGLDFIDSNSIDLFGHTINWQTVFPEEIAPTSGIVLDNDNIVFEITINEMWYHVTLQELIDSIGEPDGIITRPYVLVERPVKCAELNVAWFDSGLEVSLGLIPITEVDEASSLVATDSTIYRVSYFTAVADLDEFIMTRSADTSLDDFVAWQGFH